MPSDVVHSDPTYLHCPAVRVTPYGRDDRPEHWQAVTYWFTDPVTIGYVRREEQPEITAARRPPVRRNMPALAGVLGLIDHGQRATILQLVDCLRFRGTRHAAVEAWTPTAAGWAHTLFPYWRTAPLDDWPYKPSQDFPLYCLGTTEPSTATWTWSAPGSITYGVQEGATALFAVDAPPPPPPGLPDMSPDTVRPSGPVRRTRVPEGKEAGPAPTPTSTDTPGQRADTAGEDTPRKPRGTDTRDSGRTQGDTGSGQGVRVEYRARVPRHQLGAAIAEGFAHIAYETRADARRTPPPDPPDTVRPLTVADIATAFDLPEDLLRKDQP
ncbi:hypothetical protein [Streptomyces anulatus]|uniref:hypothetical protein n=1 Tax=Streptomyces anulatus TaxID=1892 RepID=UPI003699D299